MERKYRKDFHSENGFWKRMRRKSLPYLLLFAAPFAYSQEQPQINAPVIYKDGIVSMLTYKKEPAARGELLTLKGEFSDKECAASLQAFEKELCDTRVKIESESSSAYAPIYFVYRNQIGFQVPFETEKGKARVKVEKKSGEEWIESNAEEMDVVERAPKLFSIYPEKLGLVFDSEYKSIEMSNPLTGGKEFMIFASGFGQGNPPLESGKSGIESLLEMPESYFYNPADGFYWMAEAKRAEKSFDMVGVDRITARSYDLMPTGIMEFFTCYRDEEGNPKDFSNIVEIPVVRADEEGKPLPYLRGRVYDINDSPIKTEGKVVKNGEEKKLHIGKEGYFIAEK